MPVTSLFLSSSCKNNEVKEDFKNAKIELDRTKRAQTKYNKTLDELRDEIESLKIKKKRLEAEIIDLKIKNHEQSKQKE